MDGTEEEAEEEEEEEEERMPKPRKGPTTSGNLRSADTSAINRVIWPHEYVFTPEGQPAAYESLSPMTFVTGYITIISWTSNLSH